MLKKATEASVLRLVKTQGTVEVTNAAGKTISIAKDMTLYNGYAVKTGAGARAEITLDDKKLVELDASSLAAVAASGSKLALDVKSGRLVSETPLAIQEISKNVRISNNITGTRG